MGIVKNFYIDRTIYENNKSKSDIKVDDKVDKVRADSKIDDKGKKSKTPTKGD